MFLIALPFAFLKGSIEVLDRITSPPLVRFSMIMLTFSVLVFTSYASPNFHPASPNFHSAPVVSACCYFNSVDAQPDYEWCSDPGTNRFVTNDLSDYVPSSIVWQSTDVAVGGGNVTSPCFGTVIIEGTEHGCTIKCANVLYIKECKKKLIPASPFIRKGCSLAYGEHDQVNLYGKNGSPMLSGCEVGGLYFFKCKTLRKHNATQGKQAASPESYFGLPAGAGGSNRGVLAQDFPLRLLEAHWAYGHLNFDKLRKLLGLKRGTNPKCPSCTEATSRENPLARKRIVRSTRINHRAWLDLGFTRNNNYTFQLVIDDWSREGHLSMLESKGEALDSWMALKIHLEKKHYPLAFAFVHTDNESVYDNEAWRLFDEQQGVVHEFSSRYRHDQLGTVERAMQAVGVPFRCMMFHGNAPEADIPDALVHANVIRNNSPTSANDGRTQRGLGIKLPPNKHLLKGPLFCLVYAHVYEEERHKHAARGIPCVYLGYDDVNNTYKVKEWVSGKKYYTFDCTFHPDTFPYRANPNRDPHWLGQYDSIAPFVLSDQIPLGSELVSVRRSQRQHGYQHSAGVALKDIPDKPIAIGAESSVTRKPARPGKEPWITLNDSHSFMIHSFGDTEPSWKEAMQSRYADEWIQARLSEKNSLDLHAVYEVVPRAAAEGNRIFKPRVVLKLKLNPPSPDSPYGSIDKFKYRLTIAAYTRTLKQGIDYKEKHAATVQWNSIKIIIALAVKMDWDIVLFDIATFFLYGKLDKPVFMEQPEGWDSDEQPIRDCIWKIDRTLYGLPEAHHKAQKELRSALGAESAFHSNTADDLVFVSSDSSSGYATGGAHVDDICTTGENQGISKMRTSLSNKFKITEILNPSVITGVQVDRNRSAKWLKLHQSAFIAQLLEDQGMSDCKPADTPITDGIVKELMLLPTEPEDPTAIKLYQVLVGCLIWLHKTRLDMLFTINVACRFLKCATRKHLQLIRDRPLRYLKGTIDYGIVFQPGDGDWILSGATDADLAGDLKSSRSTSGGYMKLGEYGTIFCSSSLERKISTSSGQAETYSAASLVKEVVWERHFMAELRLPRELCLFQQSPTVVLTDNDGVLMQSTNAVNHSKAKHYRISQAYIRSMVEAGVVTMGSVATDKNEADALTKGLAVKLFGRHCLVLMGPQDRPSSV
jgi:hypothetical protein